MGRFTQWLSYALSLPPFAVDVDHVKAGRRPLTMVHMGPASANSSTTSDEWFDQVLQGLIQEWSNGVTDTVFGSHSNGVLQDTALMWSQLSRNQRKQVVREANWYGANMYLMVGGPNDTTWGTGDPAAYADEACSRASKLGFSGVDFQMDGVMDGAKVDWLIKATETCSSYVRLIAHSPTASQFNIAAGGGDGDYTNVLVGAREHIAKIMIRYAETGAYGSYAEIFTEDPVNHAAVREIKAAINAELDGFRISIAKPLLFGDATQGYVDFHTLRQWMCAAGKDPEVNFTGGVAIFTKSPSNLVQLLNTTSDLPGLSVACHSALLTPEVAETFKAKKARPIVRRNVRPTRTPTSTAAASVTTNSVTRAMVTFKDGHVPDAVLGCEAAVRSPGCVQGCFYYYARPRYCRTGTEIAEQLITCLREHHPQCFNF